MIRKVKDANGQWIRVGNGLPTAPSGGDLRGVNTLFHGRFRGPHNTGVPDKNALGIPQFGKKYSTPNQTISDQYFVGYTEINATGITFQRCRFEAKGDNLYALYANQLVTLIDCDIYGGKARDNTVVLSGAVHAIRCHIWGGGNDCISFANGSTYDGCYIHGAFPHYGTHTDVAQLYAGTTNVKMLRSKLMAFDPYTGEKFNAAMQMGSPSTPAHDIELIDNYFDGGGYAINAFLNAAGTTNIIISGNRWGRNSAFGPITGTAVPSASQGTFGPNKFDNTGGTVWQ